MRPCTTIVKQRVSYLRVAGRIARTIKPSWSRRMALWFAMLWAIVVLRDWRPQRRSRALRDGAAVRELFPTLLQTGREGARRSARAQALSSSSNPLSTAAGRSKDLARGSRPSDGVVRRPRSGSLAERHESGAAAARRHSRSLLRVDLSIDRRASDRRVLGGPPHCMERGRGAADCATQTQPKAGPPATGPAGEGH